MRFLRWLRQRASRAPDPVARIGAAAPAQAPVPTPQVATAPPVDDVMRPRDALELGRVAAGRLWAKLRQLDKDQAIGVFFERPGAHVMWALKLGRFPLREQMLRRHDNTAAGVLTWLVVLNALIGLLAAL